MIQLVAETCSETALKLLRNCQWNSGLVKPYGVFCYCAEEEMVR